MLHLTSSFLSSGLYRLALPLQPRQSSLIVFLLQQRSHFFLDIRVIFVHPFCLRLSEEIKLDHLGLYWRLARDQHSSGQRDGALTIVKYSKPRYPFPPKFSLVSTILMTWTFSILIPNLPSA